MAGTKVKRRRTSRGLTMSIRGIMDRVAAVDKGTIRTDLPEFRAGDTVRVHVKIKEGEKERIQGYEGVVIGISNKGINRSFTVRKISHSVGVERVFMMCSPKVAKVEVMQPGKVRRSKLYYLRGLEGRAARIERDLNVKETKKV